MRTGRQPRPSRARRASAPARPRVGPDRRRLLFFGLALAALVVFAVTARRVTILFFGYPVPWPDEALFADVATRLAHRGTMGTDLYRECLPTSTAHYHLTPPLYPALMALAFLVGGARLETMRVVSLLVASGVLFLLFSVARRLGMGRLALLPPTLLALDAVFVRGSLVGRMDMLTLGLVLLTLRLLISAGDESPAAEAGGPRATARGRSFGAGLAAGLAIETHPIGMTAGVLVLGAGIWPALGRLAGRSHAEKSSGDRIRPGWLAAGLTIGILPWVLYVMTDGAGFAEQYGQQLARKSSSLGFPALGIAQWGIGAVPVVTIWIAGLAGLCGAAFEERRFLLPVLAQLVLLAIVLPAFEMWYGVYLMPLTYVGIVRGMDGLLVRGAWRRVISGAFVLMAAVFAILNSARLSAIEPQYFAAGKNYEPWCRSVSDLIPAGSKVLMDGLPTPYFGLAARTDLELRLFPPRGFQIDSDRVARLLDEVDIVVAGPSISNDAVRAAVERRTIQVADVGPDQGFLFLSRLIRLRPVPGPASAPEDTAPQAPR